MFWLTAGYTVGLLFGPMLKRRKLIFDICVECGIAGGIGAAIPNLLLQSVWVQQMAASTSESAWYNLVLFLNRHIPVVNVLTSLTAIAIASAFGSRANPEPSPQANEGTNVQKFFSRTTLRRRQKFWLWLCAPAVAYNLWEHLAARNREPVWIVYTFGGFAFIGIVGYLISTSVHVLRR